MMTMKKMTNLLILTIMSKKSDFTTKEVFDNMLKNGHITEEEHDNALKLIDDFKLELYGHE